MVNFDIYSKRQKHLSGEHPDVYEYDNLPKSFRVQVEYILKDVFGESFAPSVMTTVHPTEQWFSKIHRYLAEEYGMHRLDQKGVGAQQSVLRFLETTDDVKQVLDVIDASFQLAYDLESRGERRDIVYGVEQDLGAAVEKLNTRFREHGIGYRFEPEICKVVRVDSELLHQEVVKPALRLLNAPHFAGAETEFRQAHEHFRHRRFQESINESLKALESTLKVICARKQWSFGEKDTASKLIAIVFDRGLIPKYLESQFNGLRKTLEGGVPTIRNQNSAHGTGTKPRQVPAHFAAYSLHLTASAIVFLAEAAGN